MPKCPICGEDSLHLTDHECHTQPERVSDRIHGPVRCPECGAETFVDTHCIAGDHPELTMELDFCTVCDWSGNERPYFARIQP